MAEDNSDSLEGLSCTSADSCWATGSWDWVRGETDYKTGALADHWNGHGWTAYRIASILTQDGSRNAYSVSCPTAQMCMTVGAENGIKSTSSGPFAKEWNGSSWVTAPIHNSVTTQPWIAGVSCATSQMCMAVGWLHTGSSLVEQWNGSAWSAIPGPTPPGATDSLLNGVTCLQTTNCWAVGSYSTSSGLAGVLIANWNGTSWTTQTS
jgi:hypothetical protein